MPWRNSGERRNSSQEWAKALKIPLRIWRIVSSGADAGAKAMADWAMEASDSAHIF